MIPMGQYLYHKEHLQSPEPRTCVTVRSLDFKKSNVADDSGMMVGKIEHRALTVDEVFKQYSSLTLSLGPNEESGCNSLASAFLAAQPTPTMATSLWTRIVLEAILKVSKVWETVGLLGYRNFPVDGSVFCPSRTGWPGSFQRCSFRRCLSTRLPLCLLLFSNAKQFSGLHSQPPSQLQIDPYTMVISPSYHDHFPSVMDRLCPPLQADLICVLLVVGGPRSW